MRYLLYPLILMFVSISLPVHAGWDEGVAAFKSKNYTLAAQEFQKVVDEQPDSYQGYYMLGLSQQRIGVEPLALLHLRKAYDLNPNDNNVRLALATSLHKTNAFEDIVQLLSNVEGATLPATMQATLYRLRGNARSQTDDGAGAVDDYRALAATAPDNAGYQYLYGAAAFALGDLELAMNAADAAAALQPEKAQYRAFQAKILIRKARTTNLKADKKKTYQQAIEHAASAVAIEPSYDNLTLMTSAQLGASQYVDAATSARRAISQQNNGWLAHYYLGQALSSDKQHADATTPLNTALGLAQREQDKAAVWRQLGYVYEKQKLYDNAIAAYESASDSDAAARVRENQETERHNAKVMAENENIRAMEKEAEALEKELKELERAAD